MEIIEHKIIGLSEYSIWPNVSVDFTTLYSYIRILITNFFVLIIIYS